MNRKATISGVLRWGLVEARGWRLRSGLESVRSARRHRSEMLSGLEVGCMRVAHS
jgi:hypothetical protein